MENTVYYLPGMGGHLHTGLGRGISDRNYKIVGRETLGGLWGGRTDPARMLIAVYARRTSRCSEGRLAGRCGGEAFVDHYNHQRYHESFPSQSSWLPDVVVSPL